MCIRDRQGGEVKVAGVHALHAGGYVDENLSLIHIFVQPLTANLLLAAGAVPAMLNDAEEAGC